MKSSAFNEEEFSQAYPPGIENHYWTVCRTAILADMLKGFGLREKKILEIGCGKGIVVHGLRRLHIDCLGVELADVDPLEVVRPFVTTNKNALDLPVSVRDSMQVIMLLDVIEHLEHPDVFIRNLKEGFPNATHFIVTVPARKELWSNYDEFYGHYRRYTLPMAHELARAADLKMVAQQYFFHLLYFMGYLTVKLFGKRNIKVKAPGGIMIWIHRFFAGLLFLEYKLLPENLPGTSIISVYTKQHGSCVE